QHAAEKRLVRPGMGKLLADRHGARRGGHVEAVLPETIEAEAGDAARYSVLENAMTQDQCAERIQSEIRDRPVGGGDRLPRAEEGGVDQLEDIGGHRGIASDDLRRVRYGRRGPLQARQY